jgi:hypothetical protein
LNNEMTATARLHRVVRTEGSGTKTTKDSVGDFTRVPT